MQLNVSARKMMIAGELWRESVNTFLRYNYIGSGKKR